MAGKRLVVCCDGTWNDTDSEEDLTNVSRLAWAVQPVDTRNGKDVAQIVFYQSGVGSEGDILDKIKGGGLGVGLSRNVRDAYTFICNNYCAGDEIFLFGFSRGAYTARSIAGLIGWAGLIGKHDLDRFMKLWDSYRTRKKDGHVDRRPSFASRQENVSIACIGVWDTVGALGIPGNLGSLFRHYYEFHDAELGEQVKLALHALALDERRKDFGPTLWKQTAKGKANGQVLKQVWFAGVHSDVGGGYPDHGLSDISLAWMASEVEPLLGIDFDYLLSRRDVSSKWALGQLHDSADSLLWKKRGTMARTPLSADPAVSFERLHHSVAERIRGGDEALPARYALNGIDVNAHVIALTPREETLRWRPEDVRQVERDNGTSSQAIIKKLQELSSPASIGKKIGEWLGFG